MRLAEGRGVAGVVAVAGAMCDTNLWVLGQ